MSKSTRAYHMLTLMGALPFIVGSLCLATGIDKSPIIGSIHSVLIIYGCAVGSFIAGTHWGLSLGSPHQNLLTPLTSVILTLSLVAAALLAHFATAMLWYSLIIACLVVMDQVFFIRQQISLDYLKIRLYTTAVVMASLCIAGFTYG